MKVAVLIFLFACCYLSNVNGDDLDTCLAFCESLPSSQRGGCVEACIERYSLGKKKNKKNKLLYEIDHDLKKTHNFKDLQEQTTLDGCYSICYRKFIKFLDSCRNICVKVINKFKKEDRRKLKGKDIVVDEDPESEQELEEFPLLPK